MYKKFLLITLAGLTLLTASAGRVALQADAPVPGLGPAWPLYCGVPFPRGTLVDARRVRVVDESGQAVPAQSRALARWTDSDDIRWLGVDFLGDPEQKHFLEFGPELPMLTASNDSPTISITHTKEGLLITTGPARFLVPTNGPLIARAWLDLDKNGRFDSDELVLHTDQGELYVVDQNGRIAYCGADAEPDQCNLEPDAAGLREQGNALHFTMRREGWYTTEDDHDRLARHITRLHFYAGQPFCRIEHTLVLTRNTNPTPYLTRYTKEPPIWFRDIGIRFQHTLPDASDIGFNDNPELPAKTTRFQLEPNDRSLFMFQEKAFYFSNMNPRKDCRFVIGRETVDSDPTTLLAGERCGDWVDVRNKKIGLTLAIRDFWQQYPKELQVSSNALTARLWSGRGGRELDFRLETMLTRWPTNWLNKALHGEYGNAYKYLMQRGGNNYALGLAKTHELLLNLHPADDPTVPSVVQALSRPAVVLADPHWLYQSEAMSPLYPADTNRFPLAEQYMNTYFNQYRKVFTTWGDYGFLDYGFRPHVWYRKLKRSGHPLHDRWFPYLFRYSALIDYGFAGHLWRMYARSGRRDFLDLAEETNRHRMDICMVHWDGPGVSYTNVRSWMLGKYKGGFNGSYEIMPWGPTTILHHNTGTELRHLYWYYYLRDYRRAHDVANSYYTLVKKLWTNGSKKPFTDTRPFATLKNLGTLYQETGDPQILEIGRERLAALVDLESPQGVTPDLATGLGKYTTKIGAVERWYEATGDKLAEQALLRGAGTYARTSMGNPPPDYYNIFGRILNRAYRITGDPLYARILKRNLELAVELYYDFETGRWRNTLGESVVSASNSAYPMGDLAISMDTVTRAGNLGPVPLLQQATQGRPVLAVFRKTRRQEVVFDIRGHVPLKPRVLTLEGKPVQGVVIEPFREHLYSLQPNDEPTSFLIRVPASLRADDYLLDAGVGGAPWEITWSDAPGLVLYAPGGISANGGPPWFFQVPPKTESFEVYDAARVPVFRPDGLRVAANTTQTWATVQVPVDLKSGFWKFQPQRNNAFLELRGLPTVLVCDTNRWFMPDLSRIPVEQFGLARDYRFTDESQIFDGTNALFVTGVGVDSLGLVLNGRRALAIDGGAAGVTLAPCAGTLEFWFRPNWSSVYSEHKNYVLRAGPWSIVLNYMRPRNSLFRIEDKITGRRDLLQGLTLERGEWYHLAWQWEAERDGLFRMTSFVNGSRQGSYATKNSESEQPPAPVLDRLLIGHHTNRPGTWGSLNGVIDDLRLSNRPRYTESFTPSKTLSLDAATLVLFRFEGNVQGATGDGGTVKANLLQ